MNLKGKTFVVTGSSDGIGKQTALRLAKEGVKLILVARDETKLQVVLSDTEKLGASSVEYHICDLRKIESIKSVCTEIAKNCKQIDGLINSAGIWQKLNSLENIDEQEVLDVINTNLTGLILFTKNLLPLLSQGHEAVIVNVSSRSGYSAQSGQSIYTASKYGVRGFTEVLREDLKDTNIHVAGVYQGGTNTKMFARAGEVWPEERYNSFIPPQELAEVIVFMVSRPSQVWLPEVRVESK